MAKNCFVMEVTISIGVPQGSILGPILTIFINDFHKAVEFSTVHHFADDTNLLLAENSLQKLNNHINRDLKFVVQWIQINKGKIQEKQRLLFSNQEIERLQNTLIFA